MGVSEVKWKVFQDSITLCKKLALENGVEYSGPILKEMLVDKI